MPAKNAKTYEEFLKTVEPSTLGLRSCSARLDRDLYWALHQEDRTPAGKREITAHYELAKSDKDSIDAIASLSLRVAESTDSQKEALVIECIFETHFHAAAPIQQDHARRFVNADLRIVIWPYFRQFVWDTTARMFIPPLLIPFSIGDQAQTPSSQRHLTQGRARRSRGR